MSEGVQSPVFVGRRGELAALVALLRRAEQGEPGFAIVAGEAGVGKTRLVGELTAHAADAGFTVLTGHCVELGAEGLPLAPLIDALRTLARTTPADELADVLGPARRGLGRLLPELDPGGAGEPPAEGNQVAQLLELVLGLLDRLSARRPLMLVLEDLHWADQSTRELAAFLIRSLRGVRVLLLATYRSDELNRRHPLRPLVASWERLRSVEHTELRRFDHDEVAAQLGAIFAAEPAPSLVDLIFDRSGGNAYLVEELAGVVRGGGDPADLSPSLLEVLLSRVDALSEGAQRLLAAAMVAGGLPMVLLAVVRWPAAAIFLTGLTGVGAILVEILTETSLQRELDEEVFGRAYGLAVPASLGGIVVGSLIAPLLAEALGGSGALIAVGGAVLAYAAMILRGSRGVPSAVVRSQAAMADAVPAR